MITPASPRAAFVSADRPIGGLADADSAGEHNLNNNNNNNNSNTNIASPGKTNNHHAANTRWMDNSTFMFKAEFKQAEEMAGDSEDDEEAQQGEKGRQLNGRNKTFFKGANVDSLAVVPSSPSPAQARSLSPSHLTSGDSSTFFTVLHWRAAIAELICTALFFAILFSIIITCKQLGFDGRVSLLISCYCGGLLIATFIYLFGAISGAYFSVSISVATAAIGKHSLRTCCMYIVSQLFGSILAMAIISVIYPDPVQYYSLLAIQPPDPAISAFRVVAMEFFLSFISVYIFLNISHWHGSMGPLVTGLISSTLPFIGSNVSGGVINVARVFGPAVFSGIWDKQYLYWIGTFCGSTFAGFFTIFVHEYVKQIDWTRDICLPMRQPAKTPNRLRFKAMALGGRSNGGGLTVEEMAGLIVFAGALVMATLIGVRVFE